MKRGQRASGLIFGLLTAFLGFNAYPIAKEGDVKVNSAVINTLLSQNEPGGPNCAAATLLAIGQLTVPIFVHPTALYKSKGACLTTIQQTDAKPGDIMAVLDDTGEAVHFVALLPNGLAFTRFGSGDGFVKAPLEDAVKPYPGRHEYLRFAPKKDCGVTRFEDLIRNSTNPQDLQLQTGALGLRQAFGLTPAAALSASDIDSFKKLYASIGSPSSQNEQTSDLFAHLKERIVVDVVQNQDEKDEHAQVLKIQTAILGQIEPWANQVEKDGSDADGNLLKILKSIITYAKNDFNLMYSQKLNGEAQFFVEDAISIEIQNKLTREVLLKELSASAKAHGVNINLSSGDSLIGPAIAVRIADPKIAILF